MEKPYDLIEKYKKELEDDTDINPVNLPDKQFSAPNVKHKWLYRHIQAKQRSLELQNQKEDLFRKKSSAFPAALSKAAVNAKFEKEDDIVAINKELEKQELLIEYLDSALKLIYSHLTFDFQHIVNRMKLETL
jgi:hypothetical protein